MEDRLDICPRCEGSGEGWELSLDYIDVSVIGDRFKKAIPRAFYGYHVACELCLGTGRRDL